MPTDLLFPLRKLHGNLYENRQAKIAANTLSKRIRGVDASTVFLVMTPEHGNLGDHLIWRMLRLCLRAPEARRYAAYVKEQLGDVHFDTAIIYSDRVAEIAVRAVPADRFLMFYHHGAMRREYHDEYGYRRAERIIAVSEALAEKLRAFRPRYREKIIAIYNDRL